MMLDDMIANSNEGATGYYTTLRNNNAGGESGTGPIK